MPNAAVLMADVISRAFDRGFSRHASSEVIHGGVAATATFPLATGSGRFTGLGIVSVTDSVNAVKGTGLVMFYYDGTSIVSLGLGSDLSGGGAHLTVAQLNAYVTWASTGGLQALGVTVAGNVGSAHVDLFIIDL
jgi:hypothetical protein